MSEQSPAPNSDTSMSSPGDSLVKTSAKLGSEPDLMGIARAFGLSSPVLLAKFDPDTWLPRTCQASFLCEEQWEPLRGSWPASAMWDLTSVYALRTSERAILGNESSLLRNWHTPSTEDHKSDGPRALGRYGTPEMLTSDQRLRNQAMTWPTARREGGESAGNHPGATDSLTGATRNWMTPHGMHGTDHTGKTGRGGEFAAQATQWQTPATDSFRSRGGDRKDEMGLDQQARFFPTPSASEVRQGYQRRPPGMASRQNQKSLTTIALDLSRQAPIQTSGPPSSESGPTSRRRLNPRFVEFLMGFPSGWTEL